MNPKFLKLNRQVLRNNATPEERMLWEELRNRKLDGYKFRRQHGIDIWIVDFYCPAAKLIIEVDGMYHHQIVQKEADALRDRILTEQLGLTVLRFSNTQVRHNLREVLQEIKAHLRRIVAP